MRKIAVCDDEPIFVREISKCINTILSTNQMQYEIKKINALEKTWGIQVKGELYCVDLPQILYIDSYQHKVYIHLADGKVVSYRETLSNVEKKLQRDGFVRISSGCVVNMRWIRHIKQSEIILKKEHEPVLMISRGKAAEVRQALHLYLRMGM